MFSVNMSVVNELTDGDSELCAHWRTEGLDVDPGHMESASDPPRQLNAAACSLVAGCIGVGSRQVEANQTFVDDSAKLEQNEWFTRTLQTGKQGNCFERCFLQLRHLCCSRAVWVAGWIKPGA